MNLFIVKYLEWSLYILLNVIIKQKLGVNILKFTKKANQQMYMLYYKYLEWSLFILVTVIIKQNLGVNSLYYTKKGT